MDTVDFCRFVPLDDGKHISERLHEAGQLSLLRSRHSPSEHDHVVVTEKERAPLVPQEKGLASDRRSLNQAARPTE